MAVRISGADGAPLAWDASINTDVFEMAQKVIEKGFEDMAKAAQASAKETEKALNDVKVNPIKISDLIDTQMLDGLRKIFEGLDEPTRNFIVDLVELETKLAEVAEAQDALTRAYAQGKITQEEYKTTSAQIIGATKVITDQTKALAEAQKEYDQSRANQNAPADTPAADSIAGKKAALAELIKTYEKLNDEQRKAGSGQEMASQIRALKTELAGLDPTKVTKAGQEVESMRQKLAQLTRQMLENPESPMFDTWRKQAAELKEAMSSVKVSLEQAANSTAGVEAFASGLRGLVGGFTAATGVVGMFTDNTEAADEVIKSATTALALLNGVQEVSNVLQKNGALNVYLLGLMRKKETAATIAETAAAGASTVALGAQAAATTGAATATRGLTAAMLANPAGAILVAITALASAYLLLRDSTAKAISQQEALNDTVDDFAKGATEAVKKTNDVKVAFDLARAGVISKEEALKKYNNNLGDSFGKAKNLTEAERLYAEKAPTFIKITALKAQAQALFAKAADETAKALTAQNEDHTTWWDKAKEAFINFTGVYGTGAGVILKAQEEGAAKAKELAEKNSKTLLKVGQETLEQAAKLAAEAKITFDPIDNEKEKKKKEKSHESEINALLNARKGLLEQINNLRRDADQSGLLKEASAIDKINERYDTAIRKIQAYNEKAEKFNASNPNKKVTAIGADEIARLEAARAEEVQNQTYKNNAGLYAKSLSDQQKLFEAYEDAKTEYGKQKADELYAAQMAGAATYLEFLTQQRETIAKDTTPEGFLNLEQRMKVVALEKEIEDEQGRARERGVQNQLAAYKRMLEATISYNDQKAAINKRYNELEAILAAQTNLDPKIRQEKKQMLEVQRKEELTALENDLARQSELYKVLNADLIKYTKEQLAERLKLLKKFAKEGYIIEKDGSKTILTPEMLAGLERGIASAESLNGTLDKTFGRLRIVGEGLSQIFSELGDSFGSSFLTDAGAAISGMVSQLNNLQLALKKTDDATQTSLNKIQAGATALVTLVTIVANSAKQRKAEVEAFYASVIQLQREYNLALNDQIRLQGELQANVFVNDYESRMLDGIKAAADAQTKYQEALAELNDAQVKLGQRNAVDWGNVGQGVLSGVTAGAAIGSVIPVIGTAIGAVVGGIVGGVVGLLGGKKKKEIWGSLLNEYPELIQKSIDGTEAFNEELAKSLISANLVDDKSRAILENIMDWNEKVKEAREQIKGVVEELAGSLGDDLRNSLVAAFKDGTDSAEAFGDSVNKVLENILSNLLFNQVFAKQFDELQKRMEASFDFGGDQSWVDDIAAFFEQAPSLIEEFNAAMQQANEESARRGLEVFAKKIAGDEDNSLTGAIKGMTQQQAELLAGQFGGLRITAFEQLAIAKSQLNTLNMIANNTSLLIQVEAYLRKIHVSGVKIAS